MTQLVTQHSDNLFAVALLYKSVVDDDVLLPGQTKEVCVAVRAALAAVDDEERVEREIEAFGESLDPLLQSSIFKRRELIEQWKDDDRIDRDHEHLENDAEGPDVVKETVSCLLDDGEDDGENWSAQGSEEHQLFDLVGHVRPQRRLVEAKLLLKHKGLVQTAREVKHGLQEHEDDQKDHRLRLLSRKSCRSILRQDSPGKGPDLCEHICVDEVELLSDVVDVVEEAELGLCATIRLGIERSS